MHSSSESHPRNHDKGSYRLKRKHAGERDNGATEDAWPCVKQQQQSAHPNLTARLLGKAESHPGKLQERSSSPSDLACVHTAKKLSLVSDTNCRDTLNAAFSTREDLSQPERSQAALRTDLPDPDSGAQSLPPTPSRVQAERSHSRPYLLLERPR